MTIRLEKGQRINLEKADSSKLLHFCVGCNWGAIETMREVEVKTPRLGGLLGHNITREMRKVTQDVDLDLSCLMTDKDGNMCDHIYSPLYKKSFLDHYKMPRGKVDSADGALHHSGDDLQGDTDGDGFITSKDVAFIKLALVGWGNYVFEYCDVDNDGSITAHDLAALKLLLVQ